MNKTLIFLAALKVLGILLTIGSSLLGRFVDFKQDGKITAWGRRSIAIAAISALIAVVAQAFETRNQQAADERSQQARDAENQRQTALMAQISRAVLPLNNLSFDAHLSFPAADPVFSAYLSRVRAARTAAEKSDVRRLPCTRFVDLRDARDNRSLGLASIEARMCSPLFPRIDEVVERRVSAQLGLELSFFKKPIDPNELSRRRPDAVWNARATDARVRYEFSPEQPERFEVETERMAITVKDNSNQIVSIPDLSDAQLFVSLQEAELFDDFDRNAKVEDGYQRAWKLGSLAWGQVQIGGRRFFISRFRPVLKDKPYAVFEYRFPTNIVDAPLNLP